MKGLTTAMFSRACRIFLALAYPGGPATIPTARARYFDIDGGQSLESLLVPPTCQPIPHAAGGIRGYAMRLGSSDYPHLKLQMIDCDQTGTWVFAVDTHDCIQLDANHADAERWRTLQAANRSLKEQIEHAWDAAGLLTFAGLLRRGLERNHGAATTESEIR